MFTTLVQFQLLAAMLAPAPISGAGRIDPLTKTSTSLVEPAASICHCRPLHAASKALHQIAYVAKPSNEAEHGNSGEEQGGKEKPKP
jgi:hypothetical protein